MCCPRTVSAETTRRQAKGAGDFWLWQGKLGPCQEPWQAGLVCVLWEGLGQQAWHRKSLAQHPPVPQGWEMPTATIAMGPGQAKKNSRCSLTRD